MANKTRQAAATKKGDAYGIGAILLFEINALQLPASDEAGDASKLSVGAALTKPTQDGELHFCHVKFECGRTESKERTKVDFDATYAFTFTYAGSDPMYAAKQIARTVVWTKFADLFAVANSQMRSRMPQLPFEPTFDLDIIEAEEAA